MKKVIIVGFSAALLAGGFSSCKKTSKGKMANEWTVSKMESEMTDKNSNSTTVTTTSYADGKGTKKTVTTPTTGTATTSERTAVVTEMSYTIEKDGSFKSVSDVTWTTTFDGGSSVDATKTTNTGTWSLVGKNKSAELKANERVIFSTLSSESSTKNTYTLSSGSTSSEFSSKSTYAEGESAMTYVVVESKGKE